MYVCTHKYKLHTDHSHSITSQYSAHVQNSVISYVGQDIDDGDYRHGDGDCQGQIPVRHACDPLVDVAFGETPKMYDKQTLPFC